MLSHLNLTLTTRTTWTSVCGLKSATKRSKQYELGEEEHDPVFRIYMIDYPYVFFTSYDDP